MTPEELAAHLAEATGLVERHAVAHGQLSVWVAPPAWHDVARHARECGRCRFDFFTFLTAVDLATPEAEGAGFELVAHCYSVRRQHHLTLKTEVPREGGSVATLSDLWRGANWHERETAELFGIGFEGHPNLVKLLLPEEFEGYPMRKDFLLMTREAKDWPGEKEPGEKEPGEKEPREGSA